MATTAVKICNIALSRIGASQTINDLDEASTEAGVCKLFYEHVRDSVLEDFTWPFAQKYFTLNLIEEEPNEDWLYKYSYPTDCIRAIRIVSGVSRVDAPLIPFNIGNDDSGRVVFTDAEDAVLQYTSRYEDPVRFSPSFADALSWRLAYEIAMPLSVEQSIRNTAWQLYRTAIMKSETNAANEPNYDTEREAEYIRGRE